MALDRDRLRKNAERLLKQGKLQLALDEYRRLLEETPRDLVLQNLIGDLLARLGRNADAIAVYDRIADLQSNTGFFSRAIAILKKSLKLDPSRAATHEKLADLYLKQRLFGEARQFLLAAAEGHLKARDFRRAREIYQKLVEISPKDPIAKVRLGEAVAAEGRAKEASRILAEAAAEVLSTGRHDEAERIQRRACELDPGHPGTLGGLARCLVKAGRSGEAISLLESSLGVPGSAPAIAFELMRLLLDLGRGEQVAALIDGPHGQSLPDEALEVFVVHHSARGHPDRAWVRVDGVLGSWGQRGEFTRIERVLDRLTRIEPGGHVPALKRMADFHRERGDRASTAAALEALIAAYRARSMNDEAAALLETLRETAPASGLLRIEPSAAAETPREPDTPDLSDSGIGQVEARAAAPGAPGEDILAVPVSVQDKEFLSEKTTQAEIFEKYGLLDQAVEQLKEAAARFPGLVEVYDRLLPLVRARRDRPMLRDTLVAMARALRQSGDRERAREAASEAAASAALPEPTRQMLVRIGLIAADAESSAAVPESIAPEAAPESPRRTAPSGRSVSQDEVEIAFAEEEEATPTAGPVAAAGTGQEPGPDEVELVEFYLQQGMIQDALSRLRSLRASGAWNDHLADLEQKAASARHTAPGDVEIVEVSAAEPEQHEGTFLAEEDLETLSAVLGETTVVPEAAAAAPAVQDEQSVEEVFAQFKRHVEQDVPAEDYRTHYDLGIAYKEMGLIDDAIEAFRLAARSPAVVHDAYSMIALCCREKGSLDEATSFYEEALATPGASQDALRGLSYDLAEVLSLTGKLRQALDIFRQVAAVEPGYRDVQARIAEIERSLGI
jgi:tetratricopeptide (TPR) repeat protein